MYHSKTSILALYQLMFRVLIFLSCLVILTPNTIADTNPCEKHSCIAVIDAGSTGSRLHIYSYDTDDTNTPIHIEEIWNKKIKPGFASIQPNSVTIDAYLTMLLADAPIHNIPVYFYATAGMRLLPQSQQKNTMMNWTTGLDNNRNGSWSRQKLLLGTTKHCLTGLL